MMQNPYYLAKGKQSGKTKYSMEKVYIPAQEEYEFMALKQMEYI